MSKLDFPEVTTQQLQELLKEKCNHCGQGRLHVEEVEYDLIELKCFACTRVQHTVRLSHVGRPPSGEIRKCIDCGVEFYIRPWQVKDRLATRCGDCQHKRNHPPLRLKAGSKNCQHEMDIKDGIGVCIHCGETRKYSVEQSREPIVVKRFGGDHFEDIKRRTEMASEIKEANKIKELEEQLAFKTKEIEDLKKAIPLAPVLVVEAYKAVGTFAGMLTKTVANYGLKEADAAVLDTNYGYFDSLDGLLGDWIELLGHNASDFDKGAIFGFQMLRAVLACEKTLADRIIQIAEGLTDSKR